MKVTKVKDLIMMVVSILFVFVLLMRPSVPLPQQEDTVVSDENNQSIIGIDVSHYQGTIDWADKSEKKIAFVYIKATEGKHITDPFFETNSSMTHKEKIPSGAYHFFDPRISGAEQANYFLQNLEGKKFQLPPVIDIEISHGVARKTLVERAREMYTIIQNRTGCSPMIYSDVSFYKKYIENEFEEKYLWLAEYGVKEPPSVNSNRMVMWQKTDHGKFRLIKGLVDVNEYLGDRSAFVKFACNA